MTCHFLHQDFFQLGMMGHKSPFLRNNMLPAHRDLAQGASMAPPFFFSVRNGDASVMFHD